MPLTLTDDPHFYGLEILLSNILMIGLFRSNNRMVIFSEKKTVILQQTCKGSYIYYVHMEEGWSNRKGLKIGHIFADSFVFKQKIYCSFFRMARVGYRTSRITKLVISCCHHKCMIRKWFKITTNPIIRGSNLFFNIKITAGYILTA